MMRQRGFTLVEVLLALVVLSSVMVVLGQTLGATARAYDNINLTRLGHQVAADKLVELQVFQEWPEIGTSDDRVEQDDRIWWRRTQVTAGPFPNTRRVDIEVGLMRDSQRQDTVFVMASLIGMPVQ